MHGRRAEPERTVKAGKGHPAPGRTGSPQGIPAVHRAGRKQKRGGGARAHPCAGHPQLKGAGGTRRIKRLGRRKPFAGHMGAQPEKSGARLFGYHRTGSGKKSGSHCRVRLSQSAPDRDKGSGKDHDRQPDPGDLSGNDLGGKYGGFQDLQRGRTAFRGKPDYAGASFPKSPSYRLSPVHGRRRAVSQAGRDHAGAQRDPLSG